jgi:hypothetical protein
MWSTDQQRFLAVYRERRAVAPAAREAEIHRSTVYRWRKDPAFAQAMEAAAQAGYEQWRREVYPREEAARRAAREQRERELLPMKRANLAKALEARRRKLGY